MTLKNYTGQHPQCFPPHFLRFFHDDDTPDTVPSNQEEIRIKRKGRKDVICYSNYNPMNYENGWCHTKVGNLVAKKAYFKKVLFFREIIICWIIMIMRVKAGVSAAMNAFLTRPSQTAAFFGRKTRYMFFPRSSVKNT